MAVLSTEERLKLISEISKREDLTKEDIVSYLYSGKEVEKEVEKEPIVEPSFIPELDVSKKDESVAPIVKKEESLPKKEEYIEKIPKEELKTESIQNTKKLISKEGYTIYNPNYTDLVELDSAKVPYDNEVGTSYEEGSNTNTKEKHLTKTLTNPDIPKGYTPYKEDKDNLTVSYASARTVSPEDFISSAVIK